jgi:hypothetical protein
LSGQIASLWLVVQPPAEAATQVPSPTLLVFVLQMSPLGHCESLVQPPQKFGVEKPQVGVGAAHAEFAVQFPGAHDPLMHTYGLELLPYAPVQPVSVPALEPPLSQGAHAPLTHTPLTAPIGQAVPSVHGAAPASASPASAPLSPPSAPVPLSPPSAWVPLSPASAPLPLSPASAPLPLEPLPVSAPESPAPELVPVSALESPPPELLTPVSVPVRPGASGVSAESPPPLEASVWLVASAPESVASEDDESPPQPAKLATAPQPSRLTIANQPYEAPNLRIWTYSPFLRTNESNM